MRRRTAVRAVALVLALASSGCAGLVGGKVVTEQLETGERTIERVQTDVDGINQDQDARQSELDSVTDEAD